MLPMLMRRATYYGAEKLAGADYSLPKSGTDTLKKLALLTFLADASLDALQISARSVTSSLVVMHNI